MTFKVMFAVSIFSLSSVAAETPDEIREKGFVALKAAQDDPDRIVEAAKYLTEAANAYQLAGDEVKAQETESYLYWAKKKMTIQQIDAFVAKDGASAQKVVEKMEAVEKKEVKPEDAAAYLARVNTYAEKVKDPFFAAVLYFEVASRFKGTPESTQAMEKSLAALQKSRAVVDPARPTEIAFDPNQSDEFGRAMTEHKKAIAKAKDNYLKALEGMLDNVARRGDTNSALVIKNEIQKVAGMTYSDLLVTDPVLMKIRLSYDNVGS